MLGLPGENNSVFESLITVWAIFGLPRKHAHFFWSHFSDSQISCLKMRLPLAKLAQQHEAQKEMELDVFFIVCSPSVLTCSDYINGIKVILPLSSCQAKIALNNTSRWGINLWILSLRGCCQKSYITHFKEMSSAPCCILSVWSPTNVLAVNPSIRPCVHVCLRACIHTYVQGCMDGLMDA